MQLQASEARSSVKKAEVPDISLNFYVKPAGRSVIQL